MVCDGKNAQDVLGQLKDLPQLSEFSLTDDYRSYLQKKSELEEVRFVLGMDLTLND